MQTLYSPHPMISYLESVNAEHVGTETLSGEGVADRGALVDDKDASLLELLDVLAGCIDWFVRFDQIDMK